MTRQQLLARMERAWAALRESFSGLSDAQLTEPGVAGEWSVKDVLAHVTTWDEEALKYLPLIHSGGRPPRYANLPVSGSSQSMEAPTCCPSSTSRTDCFRRPQSHSLRL